MPLRKMVENASERSGLILVTVRRIPGLGTGHPVNGELSSEAPSGLELKASQASLESAAGKSAEPGLLENGWREKSVRKMGAQLWWSIIYAILGGLVFILGLNLLQSIPERFRDIYKIGLPVLFLAAYFVSPRVAPNQKAIFWAFFLVSVGWVLDNYLTGRIKDLSSLNTKQLSGTAYTMVISTLLVSAPVILGWLASGQPLSTIYIQSDKTIWGIVVGIIGLLVFSGLGGLQALGQGLTIEMVGAAIPMALVFSLANGFREELVYRAVFLKSFQANIGVVATVIVTTLVFALAHVDVGYDPASMIVFSIGLVIIGVAGSLIMIKTGSLIGAVLFHAGADILLVLELLSSQQLTLQ